MTQSPSRSRRNGWPLGLIGMVALVVATERYIARRDIDLGTITTIEWRRTGRAAVKEAPRAEILCFGTSLTRLGISPNILKQRTGMETYSLALSGGQPYATYTMLRRALDAGAKPKVIVVDYKWTSLSMDPAGAERIFPEIATFPECLELARVVGDSSFLGRLALVSWLPSYRCRAEIRQNIAAAFNGLEPERNPTWLTMARNVNVNRGAHHAPRVEFTGEIRPSARAIFEANWRPQPVSEFYINKFLDLAESRGIPVFWLIPPISPGAQETLRQVGADDRYAAFVRRTVANHPCASVLDARGSLYPKDAFFDLTHLNRYGTANLSEDVADAILARLRPPGPAPAGWVGLPKYRGGAAGEGLEDFLGSHQAVAARFKDKTRR